MPGPVIDRPVYPEGTPPWLEEIFNTLQLNPATSAVWSGGGAGEPFLGSLGKKVSELLDTVFSRATSAEGRSLPKRLRFTNWDARSGNMQFHPDQPSAEIGPAPFEATPAQVDRLVNGGALDVEQPGSRAVDQIRRHLREVLDAHGPELKDQQVRRGLNKK